MRTRRSSCPRCFYIIRPESVVLAVLEILTRSGRSAAVPTIDRIANHDSPTVRAAALAARSVLAPDADHLRQRLEAEESPEVRAAIGINLLVAGTLRTPSVNGKSRLYS